MNDSDETETCKYWDGPVEVEKSESCSEGIMKSQDISRKGFCLSIRVDPVGCNLYWVLTVLWMLQVSIDRNPKHPETIENLEIFWTNC